MLPFTIVPLVSLIAFSSHAVVAAPTASPSCQAVAEMFKALKGKGEVGDNCCEFKGVKCVDGRVTEISWPDQGLRGSLPTQLYNLHDLQVLDLHNNEITGPLPHFRLPQLTKLYLEKNQFSGTLESVGFENLWKLDELLLQNNKFEGNVPSKIFAGLPELDIINLSGNADLDKTISEEFQEKCTGATATITCTF
jgi:hypothetical protein